MSKYVEAVAPPNSIKPFLTGNERKCPQCGGWNTYFNFAALALACWHCFRVFDASNVSEVTTR